MHHFLTKNGIKPDTFAYHLHYDSRLSDAENKRIKSEQLLMALSLGISDYDGSPKEDGQSNPIGKGHLGPGQSGNITFSHYYELLGALDISINDQPPETFPTMLQRLAKLPENKLSEQKYQLTEADILGAIETVTKIHEGA